MSELPEKVIVSMGCHDCPFANNFASGALCNVVNRSISNYIMQQLFHPQCPLLTHTIKVVKND